MGLQALQETVERCVNEGVANLHARAGDHRWVNVNVYLFFSTLQRLCNQSGKLRVLDRCCHAHRAAFGRSNELLERLGKFDNEVRVPSLSHKSDNATDGCVELR